MSSVNDIKQAQRYIGFNQEKRPKGDFYPSPPIAVEKLLEHEHFGNKIWEPACGKGDISSILVKHGYNVFSTDLYDWGYGTGGIDFLLSDNKYWADAVITNPPFNEPRGISTKFAYKALEVTKANHGKVALLQRIQFLEGVGRNKLFTEQPFSRCLVFSKRLPRMHRFDFEGKGNSSMMGFAWYIWDWQHEGDPTIHWI